MTVAQELEPAVRLRTGVFASAGIHAVVFILAVTTGFLLAPMHPEPLIVSLTPGRGGGTGPTGAEIPAATPGGRAGTSLAPAKAAVKGQVSIATPEFVPVGRRPRRSGEELMGTGPAGEGGGPASPIMGEGAGGSGGRRLRYQEPLEYPEWAKEQGIDAKVQLEFTVNPDGSVDPHIIVRRTSGWRQLDELAMKALRQFLFEPLPPGAAQHAQRGELTFHFKPE
jgi:TonB family protein